MEVTYRVVEVSRTTNQGSVEYPPGSGNLISVPIPEVEVVLVDEGAQHGSHVLHFRTPEEIEHALATYKKGEVITREV